MQALNISQTKYNTKLHFAFTLKIYFVIQRKIQRKIQFHIY